MDQQSISEEELEYECLRILCDTAIAYRNLAETSGMGFPRMTDTIGYLEEQLSRMSSDFGEFEIVL
ncbi:MAG: hypothetical protein II855_04165 [Candidatus Methanomethylophilaceae archaeon]|nr:hypothetical protein [Candidatus Methanomethylophilaceae archaeon]